MSFSKFLRISLEVPIELREYGWVGCTMCLHYEDVLFCALCTLYTRISLEIEHVHKALELESDLKSTGVTT